MSKENEILNIYIEQQQNQIQEMNKSILMLTTKNIILERELNSLKNINKEANNTQQKEPDVQSKRMTIGSRTRNS
jgi:hypothetical protein